MKVKVRPAQHCPTNPACHIKICLHSAWQCAYIENWRDERAFKPSKFYRSKYSYKEGSSLDRMSDIIDNLRTAQKKAEASGNPKAASFVGHQVSLKPKKKTLITVLMQSFWQRCSKQFSHLRHGQWSWYELSSSSSFPGNYIFLEYHPNNPNLAF